ncbi:hypothetical protein CRG98_026961 [Punica granatum]|uniref:Uncharacterized protein n=1 Tax=Punica granatum TaxID=22663 RepID=A0A2I0J8P3_PUNGR|nr:hypothetical protein CRG98_026961 [Punica granatum]
MWVSENPLIQARSEAREAMKIERETETETERSIPAEDRAIKSGRFQEKERNLDGSGAESYCKRTRSYWALVGSIRWGNGQVLRGSSDEHVPESFGQAELKRTRIDSKYVTGGGNIYS